MAKKDKKLSMQVSEELLAQIDKQADELGLSRSDVVRQILRAFFAKK